MKFTKISKFKLGESIKGFYICKNKNILYTRKNEIYLDILLTDSSGEITAKMWDLVDNYKDRFKSGDPVAVKAKVSEYNNKLQLIVTHINYANLKLYNQYGFNIANLIPKVDDDLDELWDRLFQVTKLIKSPIKDLVKLILNTYKLKIQNIPFSLDGINPRSGSFLKHIVSNAEIATKILSDFPNLDKDLCLSGIMLSDIGKVKSINNDIIPEYTKEGKLIGYLVLGVDIIFKYSKSIKNIPNEKLVKLEYIILYQQNNLQQNAMNKCEVPEAIFVNYINKLNTELNQFIS